MQKHDPLQLMSVKPPKMKDQSLDSSLETDTQELKSLNTSASQNKSVTNRFGFMAMESRVISQDEVKI